MGHRVRQAQLADADDLGRVHVRAWEAAYRGGLMPDEYLDEITVEGRAEMWRVGLASTPRPRAARLVAELDRDAVQAGHEDTGSVIGFIVVGPAGGDADAAVGEVHAINVDPAHWGAGVGANLLVAGTSFLADAGFDRAILWVHPDNHRTRAFYAARGWTDDEVVRRQDVLGVDVPETRYSRPLP